MRWLGYVNAFMYSNWLTFHFGSETQKRERNGERKQKCCFGAWRLNPVGTCRYRSRGPPTGRWKSVKDKLEGYCNQNGGLWIAPGLGGVYGCLLPDGTLIACGGAIPYCTETRKAEAGELLAVRSVIAIEEQLLASIKTLETKVQSLESKVTEMEKRQR